MNLKFLHRMKMTQRNKIFALRQTRLDGGSFLLLKEYGIPSIYQLGGKFMTFSRFFLNFLISGVPFAKKWIDFPVKLEFSPWAQEFVDKDGSYFLVFGDWNRAYVTKLVWNGEQLIDNPISCI